MRSPLCFLHPLAELEATLERWQRADSVTFVVAAYDTAIKQVDQDPREFGDILTYLVMG